MDLSFSKHWHPETYAIRLQQERSRQREHSVPVFLTSSFVFESAQQASSLFAEEMEGNIYSRFSNPNVEELIQKMCALEKTEDGVATATGMAAVFSSLAALLQKGDHIVSSRSVFGSTHQLFTKIFPAWGIHTTYVSQSDPNDWEKAITPSTKIFFLETPSNPGLEIAPLEEICRLAQKNHILVVVDNCFATPVLQQPSQWGVHIVLHSATKFLDGQGRVLGGLILGKKELVEKIRYFVRHTGPALSAFHAWILSKSIETLHIRMEKHQQTAAFLYEKLKGHPYINKILYPGSPDHPYYEWVKRQMKGGGGLLTIDLTGGYPSAQRFLNSLRWISHTANLGDTRTIVTHPASTTHSKLSEEERRKVGITPGLIRISCGLEHPEDILNELLHALKSFE